MVMKYAFGLCMTALFASCLSLGCRNSSADDPVVSEGQAEQNEKDAEIRSSLAALSSEDRKAAAEQRFCAVQTDNRLGSMGTPVKVMIKEQAVFLCCKSCLRKALAHPDKTLTTVKALKAKQSGVSQSSPVAVTVGEVGKVVLLNRDTLTLARTIEPDQQRPAAAPMLVVEDAARRVFYVGNFNKGLGRIPMDAGKSKTLDLGGVLIGVAISPDGRLLAVNGAHDLTLRLVDLDAWQVAATVRFGNPSDSPRHSHMTHGLASTHPIWLPDGSGVLTEDNIHEEVVLIGRDGNERSRCRLRSGVHTFVTTKGDEVLALAEGTVDGSVPPCVVALSLPSLKVVRETVVPLESGEPAKLHHGALSKDGDVLIVANMGPMHGAKFGRTVAALNWRTGQVFWHSPTVRNAGHVRFLDTDRVIVLGHQDASLAVLDAKTGNRLQAWTIAGATSLGHSLAEESGDTVLVVNSGAGRVVRVGVDGIKDQSHFLGNEVSEASLPE
jgi:hypothetical protein